MSKIPAQIRHHSFEILAFLHPLVHFCHHVGVPKRIQTFGFRTPQLRCGKHQPVDRRRLRVLFETRVPEQEHGPRFAGEHQVLLQPGTGYGRYLVGADRA